MTMHELMGISARQMVMTFSFLLLILHMILVYTVFRDKRSCRMQVINLMLFLVNAAVFYLMLLHICWGVNGLSEKKQLSFLLVFFNALPVSAVILYMILDAVFLAAALRELFLFRKNFLTRESIKETMDLLPVGIAFGKEDGTVVFSNLTMNDLSRTLTGKSLSNLLSFQESIKKRVKEKGQNGALIQIPDSSDVWQLAAETLEIDGEFMIQLTATDISGQAAVMKELEEKNEKLRDIHMRLSIYNKQVGRIIIAQELLTARMAVHNEVGNVLLESRHYLQDPASFDEQRLLQALKMTNTYLLKDFEEDDTAGDTLTEAMEMAEAVGVDVIISGVIPADEPFRRILAAAIRECASNTVKHADGDTLSVDIQKEAGEMVYVFKNNGIQPQELIRESGGLSSLRLLVEKENGTMKTEISPAFQLTIRLPKAH